MDWIATIFTILLLIVPVIAKFVEKSLSQAGKPGAGRTVRDILESFGDEEAAGPAESSTERKAIQLPPVFKEVFPTSVIKPETVPPALQQTAARAQEPAISAEETAPGRTQQVPGMQNEIYCPGEQKDKGGFRIDDPKKLVIYSEIMRPKFRDSF